MVEIRWTKRSIVDVDLIAEYISKDSVKYAELQVKLFFAVEQKLIQFPNLGRIVPELNRKNTREIIIANYRLIYKIVSKSRIDIITVHHTKKLFKK
ncbi:MAG: type II toxin-antitoxin system RelE/ParE family toxin [Bacteroidota bacterium]